MTVTLTTVETASDALFYCAYRWAHGHLITRSEIEKARLAHKDPSTRYGKLVARLQQALELPYESFADAGYVSTNSDQMLAVRRNLLVEEIGESEIDTWLKDTARIGRVFPQSGLIATRTTLPLTRGSEGYNVKQDYVIKHFLPAQSLCSIYGPSGSYKSFLAVSWACHIAAGMEWSGRKVTAGAVLYIVGEGGVGVPRRIRAWEQATGKKVDNLWLVNRPVFPERREEVDEVIRASKQIKAECGVPVQLIVIDTLARCFGGDDENNARDMGAFIEGCDNIKRLTGASVLVVHHSGKDEAKGARGSSSFRAALDAEFSVKREGDGKALILTCTKMKDAEEPQKKAYDLRTVELFQDDDGENICSLVVRDVARTAVDIDPALASISNLSENHATLWSLICSRTKNGTGCTKALLRDDMRAMGIDISKNFTRWLGKLESSELIKIYGEEVRPVSKRKSEGESEE